MRDETESAKIVQSASSLLSEFCIRIHQLIGINCLAAAERAAAYGAQVAIVEQTAIGGACINSGCVPEKLLDYAARFHPLDQAAIGYGWNSSRSLLQLVTICHR